MATIRFCPKPLNNIVAKLRLLDDFSYKVLEALAAALAAAAQLSVTACVRRFSARCRGSNHDGVPASNTCYGVLGGV